MKQVRWYLFLTAALVGISAGFYLIQIAMFHKTGDTFFYMLQDIAFVPVQVLLVTLIGQEVLFPQCLYCYPFCCFENRFFPFLCSCLDIEPDLWFSA